MRTGFVSHGQAILDLISSEASPFVKQRLSCVLILVITASILSAVAPIPLKFVVDGMTGREGGFDSSPLLLIGLFVSSQFLARGAGEVRALIYAGAERRLFRTISARLFGHLMRLPLRFHLERQTGAVNQTLVNGLQGYQLILHHLVFTFLPVMAELGTIIVVLDRVTPSEILALFCLAIACYGVAFGYALRRTTPAARAASIANVEASASMTDGILNYETVKYFAAEGVVQERVDQALARTESAWLSFYRRFAVSGFCVATIFACFIGVTTVYAAREVQRGHMTVGDFVLINTYLLQVVRPVETLGYAMQGLSQGWAMLEKLLEVFEQIPELRPIVGCVPTESTCTTRPGTVEFESVSLAYRPNHSVLNGLSFTIPAGKTLGIVGSSGSGKSTTVRLLTRLMEPDRGRILLDGVPIRDLPLSQLRGLVAVVPQETMLFNETIAFNIAFGKPNCPRRDIEHAARLAHLHDFVMSLPDQYDTQVGERGVKLSGGEKQRVSIARAVIKRPLIYVFDEATSSLDTQMERRILRSLREISRSSTTLIIAHRLSSVVHADEIVVLDAGTVVERGTHERLVRSHGFYASLWQAQHCGSAAVI